MILQLIYEILNYYYKLCVIYKDYRLFRDVKKYYTKNYVYNYDQENEKSQK